MGRHLYMSEYGKRKRGKKALARLLERFRDAEIRASGPQPPGSTLDPKRRFLER